MNILKICGIAAVGLAVFLLLRQSKPDYASVVTALVGILLLAWILPSVAAMIQEAEGLIKDSGFSAYIRVILKAIGVGFLTQITADTCRECGASGIAAKVEFGAKILILGLAVPILQELLSYITEFIK